MHFGCLKGDDDTFDKFHKSLEINLGVNTADVSSTFENPLQPQLHFLLHVEFLKVINDTDTIYFFVELF